MLSLISIKILIHISIFFLEELKALKPYARHLNLKVIHFVVFVVDKKVHLYFLVD